MTVQLADEVGLAYQVLAHVFHGCQATWHGQCVLPDRFATAYTVSGSLRLSRLYPPSVATENSVQTHRGVSSANELNSEVGEISWGPSTSIMHLSMSCSTLHPSGASKGVGETGALVGLLIQRWLCNGDRCCRWWYILSICTQAVITPFETIWWHKIWAVNGCYGQCIHTPRGWHCWYDTRSWVYVDVHPPILSWLQLKNYFWNSRKPSNDLKVN